MRHYEATIVLDPGLAEGGHGRQVEKIVKAIEKGGGTNLSEDRWGVRTLAYPIDKHDQGFYTVLKWEGEGEMIAELDQILRLDENVLRHLIIHLDAAALETMEQIRQRRAESEEESERDESDEDDDEDEEEDEEENEEEDEDEGRNESEGAEEER